MCAGGCNIPFLFLWLIFQPNTCYLLTEWRHYLSFLSKNSVWFNHAQYSAQGMFDFLTLTGSYAIYTGIGMSLFFLSIWPLDREIKPSRLLKGLFFFACAIGVYLGLVRRFNSWDVDHPFRILNATRLAFESLPLALLILAFGALLWAMYFTFGLTLDGLALRLARARKTASAGGSSC